MNKDYKMPEEIEYQFNIKTIIIAVLMLIVFVFMIIKYYEYNMITEHLNGLWYVPQSFFTDSQIKGNQIYINVKNGILIDMISQKDSPKELSTNEYKVEIWPVLFESLYSQYYIFRIDGLTDVYYIYYKPNGSKMYFMDKSKNIMGLYYNDIENNDIIM